MKAYKGFDRDLRCRGFQYEVGKEYEEEKAEICECGFHACENPLDVFEYYPPVDSRYCEVDLDANDQTAGDSKRVGKKIRISAEIGLPGLIKAGIKYIKERVDWENFKEFNTGDRSVATNTGNRSVAANTGDWSAATNTGDRSAAANTGDQSAATNTGNRSAAMNTGNWSVAANTGDQSAAVNTGDRSVAANTGGQSAAIVSGKESIAIAVGSGCRAKGSIGCFLVLAEWKGTDGEWRISDVKAVKVDGDKIKADVFYKLRNGEFLEVRESASE